MKVMDHTAYAKKVKKMTSAELLFVSKDCKEVLDAWPDHPNAGYYLDEMHYCGMELARRNRVDLTLCEVSGFINNVISVVYSKPNTL